VIVNLPSVSGQHIVLRLAGCIVKHQAAPAHLEVAQLALLVPVHLPL